MTELIISKDLNMQQDQYTSVLDSISLELFMNYYSAIESRNAYYNGSHYDQ